MTIEILNMGERHYADLKAAYAAAAAMMMGAFKAAR